MIKWRQNDQVSGLQPKLKIGIPFEYDEKWIGGTYYLSNVILAFSRLQEEERPEIHIITDNEQSFSYIQNVVKDIPLVWANTWARFDLSTVYYRLCKKLGRHPLPRLKQYDEFDLIFPHYLETHYEKNVCWIPDFQDKHLPNFFDRFELKKRQAQHEFFINRFKCIVFSSRSAQKDFMRFYPHNKLTSFVVPFAVFHSDISSLMIEDIRSKYGIRADYFYAPNQFWAHKNHKVVIEAFQLAQSHCRPLQILFSGKEHDYRFPGYTESLKNLVSESGLRDDILFLGFLPRDEQLCLMKNARCIIQPSFFEGWSTVIEDAKALSRYVLASDLEVHKEQLLFNVDFFNPKNPEELAQLIAKYSTSYPNVKPLDYAKNQKAFAIRLIELANHVRQSNRKH